mgnify:CR=1 FL=1
MAKSVKKTVKSVAKKTTAKKTSALAPKKAVAKTTAKESPKKAAPKAKSTTKPVAKKESPKKTTSVKSVAKKTVSKKAVAKATTKPSPKKATPKAKVSKPAVKKVAKSTVKTQVEKSAKLALRKKKIQEIKNNYESPAVFDEENYEDYKLPIIGRTRYKDAELNEFKVLINKKIAEAREELNFYQDQMKESEMNDDDIKFSGMEDGGHTNDKEHLSSMANRQIKFIQNLESALVRIENKTYGICRMTGNLIDKKRLMAVPHATLSMEAKTGGKKK